MFMKEKRQLLCTFSNKADFKGVINDIKKFYTIYNKIFVFNSCIDLNEVYITYNIINDSFDKFPKFRDTISIHRKKQTNTLYTLNAMNLIIKDDNDGKFDKSFKINWELYKNSLIITGSPAFRIIPLKILDIIN